MSDEHQPEVPRPPAAPPRRRGVFGWLWRLALLVLLLVLAGVAWVVGTETGTQAVLRLAQSMAPVPLQVESASGRLAGPLEVRGLRIGAGEGAVEIDRAALDWRPRELLAGRLHLAKLELQGLRVTPDETPSPEGPAALPDVALPLEVVIDRIEISDAKILKDGIPPLEHAVLRGRAIGSALQIDELSLRLPALRLAAAGGIGLGAGTASDLRLDWSWDAPQGQSVNGAGRVTGPIDALQVEHRISGAAEATLTGAVTGLPGAPRWDAAIDLARVEPALLVPDVPGLTLSGRLSSRGAPTDFSAEGRLQVAEAELGTHQVDLAATVVGDAVQVQRLDVTQPDGPAKLSATGRARLGDDPEFTAEAHWTALRWPPRGEAVAASPEGRLTVEGRASAYRFAATGTAVAPQAPATGFDAAGTGDTTRARIERLRLELLKGSVDASGEIGWAPEPRWDLSATMTDIDPGVQWPEWGGRLKGSLTSRGRIGPEGPEAAFEIGRIDGKLRGYPVDLSAGAQVGAGAVTVDRFALNSGNAHLEAAGSLGDVLDLTWSVDAPELGQLLPDAAGSLKGEGRLTGTREQPRLTAKLDGSGLRVQDNALTRLTLDADLGITPDAPLRLNLAAKGISAAGKAVGDLAAKAGGSPREHRVTLDLAGGELGIGSSIALAGGVVDGQSWAGKLERADLRAAEWGDWRLQRPADVAIGAASKVAPVCLGSGAARICIEGSREADGAWKGALDLSSVPLSLVQTHLPKDTTIAGAVNAKAVASGNAAGGLTADATVTLPGARLRVPMGHEVRDLDLSKSTVTAKVDGKGARAEARLLAGDLATVDAKADLPGWTPQSDPAKQRLGGTLRANLPDLAFVKAFAPDLGAVEGQVAFDLGLDGTLAKPRATGKGDLTRGRIEVPDAGVDIRDLRLTVRSQGGDRLDYEGGARSGEGSLRLTGQTVLDPKQGWPTNLQLGGRDFTVFNTSEYVAVVSPDLQLKSGKDGSLLEGELLIPRATLRPAALPKGAVAPSKDVHIKGKEPPPKPGGPPFATRVRVRLGDQVRVDAYQLRARLEGNVLVEQQAGKDLIGNGRLGIAEGTYSGLGKDLTIQRGELNFASSPLDNPGLNVRAVTETPEVTAGMLMTGTAKEPKIELFSKPPRPQSEVLSYLLFGKPLSGTTKEDSGTLTDAAGALGGNLLASQIGRQLGLDELSVSGTGDKAALTVGEYVTPQLYLQYVSGLRSQINRLRIRYDVTRWLQVQTETGDQQGADVFYIFER